MAAPPHRAAVKKRDWLRAETAKTPENQRSRRCLSQFFHSLRAACRCVVVSYIVSNVAPTGTLSVNREIEQLKTGKGQFFGKNLSGDNAAAVDAVFLGDQIDGGVASFDDNDLDLFLLSLVRVRLSRLPLAGKRFGCGRAQRGRLGQVRKVVSRQLFSYFLPPRAITDS
jgi:hypothetical protein